MTIDDGQLRERQMAELQSEMPPEFHGPIRSIDDLRARLNRSIWALDMTDIVAPGGLTKLHRGKRSAYLDLLDQLDWPDTCDKCGASPVVDRIEEFAMCHNCIAAWCDAQDLVDGETA